MEQQHSIPIYGKYDLVIIIIASRAPCMTTPPYGCPQRSSHLNPKGGIEILTFFTLIDCFSVVFFTKPNVNAAELPSTPLLQYSSHSFTQLRLHHRLLLRVGYSISWVAITFRSNRNRKIRSIESPSKFRAIATPIRSEIPIDQMFPAITDFVVSAKGTTPHPKNTPPSPEFGS